MRCVDARRGPRLEPNGAVLPGHQPADRSVRTCRMPEAGANAPYQATFRHCRRAASDVAEAAQVRTAPQAEPAEGTILIDHSPENQERSPMGSRDE